MGCCTSSDAQDGARMSRRYSDWSLPSVVHQEDSRAHLTGGRYYDGSPNGMNGGASVRSLVSQSNARKWSEELFEEKMANRRQEREHSIRSNRGDATSRSNRSYRGDLTNRSYRGDATNRSHVGDLTGRSYRGGEATNRSCNRYNAGGDCTTRSTVYNYARGDTTSRSTRSTSRVIRGEESMSSEFGGGGGMPPQHPIRVNYSYPNVPRETSGEGSSVGEWQGHSPMPSSLPPTVPLATRSPISRRPARSPAAFRRSQTASNFMPSPRSRVPLPSPRSGLPNRMPARTAM